MCFNPFLLKNLSMLHLKYVYKIFKNPIKNLPYYGIAAVLLSLLLCCFHN